MSTTTFNYLIDKYAGRISRTAMVYLKDQHKADDVMFYTFSTVADFDVTNEEVIFLIAMEETHNGLFNLALAYRPKWYRRIIIAFLKWSSILNYKPKV